MKKQKTGKEYFIKKGDKIKKPGILFPAFFKF